MAIWRQVGRPIPDNLPPGTYGASIVNSYSEGQDFIIEFEYAPERALEYCLIKFVKEA